MFTVIYSMSPPGPSYLCNCNNHPHCCPSAAPPTIVSASQEPEHHWTVNQSISVPLSKALLGLPDLKLMIEYHRGSNEPTLGHFLGVNSHLLSIPGHKAFGARQVACKQRDLLILLPKRFFPPMPLELSSLIPWLTHWAKISPSLSFCVLHSTPLVL